MVERLEFPRYFTKAGQNVYDDFDYVREDVGIADDSGKVTFVQKGAEFPIAWSGLAKKIVASKYFYGEKGTPQRENSIKDLVGRVSGYISEWSVRQEYFNSPEESEVFRDELAFLHLDQRMAFNSPVWFNVGTHRIAGNGSKDQKTAYIVDESVEGSVKRLPVGMDRHYPQTSACFIQSVKDTMEDIMDLATREALLFKYGSGTGTNLSTLRSSRERLSGGGKPSGPLAYWAFYDKVAGIVKSGGKTRRAAKMDILNISHPDILDFINSKMREEEKIRILRAAGISAVEAQESVNYQNTNISVRVTDDFMMAVEIDGIWQTVPVHNKDMIDDMPQYRAKELFTAMAKAAHASGDPGIQYHDTINKWHTTPNTAPINASNPCSEYMHVDDSSCNLASLNLMKFLGGRNFQVEDFRQAVRTTTIAQDLEFDNSSYPTEAIARNSHRLRNLGQGYANLGSLLMSLGMPYDSPEARAVAASITALQTGVVYETSSEMAEKIGPFEEFEKNREPMLKVMDMHRKALDNIDRKALPEGLENILDEAYTTWERVIEKGNKYGFRNAQATVLAPTGTIGFFMDCDTLGVEPEIGLVQTKLLADNAGVLRRVNGMVEPVLKNLGYTEEQIKDVKEYIAGHQEIEGTPHLREEDFGLVAKIRDEKVKIENGEEDLVRAGYKPSQIKEIVEHLDGYETMEGAPHVREEHLAIFDTSNKPEWATRSISFEGHINMMAAVQPFLSGAISKTVNMPAEATEKDVEDTYMMGWKKGLKSIAIYRDGSKGVQVLSFRKDKESKLEGAVTNPVRRKLPTTAKSIRHKFDISGHEGYVHVGLYDDGTPGEVFINMSKEGSTVGGLTDAFATSISLNLQYGVPLKNLVKKFRHQRFEPSGMVWEGHPDIKTADSLVDYIFGFLEKEFLTEESNGNENGHKETEIPSRPIIKTGGNSDEEELEESGFCATCSGPMFKKNNCVEKCDRCGGEDPRGCGAS
ncbi:MAG: ribonucleoside-diphosphate reductase, adenosylcobalamin-dependent [Candidatus Zambryskibacteria bacterium CG10_big_fil_rev_8_21_14_0_10_34_34]|uniref:Vitamin B12-dependent ribonucleotide reductase n=1 Tax=Candidatus Zambryskibacteria bacterium CG10_big_fil_rev_8_21_14_0_10_34_34 TaxID=1975114 RepID=A0A2H0R1P4_9BACT|nr:MAG: ribonucleoside-diphosphate reductase, adenosylcobalamin-dependent [Candidatus Zambryskibacteria bacterium CG10_big_fil_rev_8_21_14_0_10_34_34]